jgi:hypothetical protein
MIVLAAYKCGSMGQCLRKKQRRPPLVPEYEITDPIRLERAYEDARNNYLSLHGAKTSGWCGILFVYVGMLIAITGMAITAGLDPAADAAVSVSGGETVRGFFTLSICQKADRRNHEVCGG